MTKQQTLRGVNLGGWLVVEKWMTPSLFAGEMARNEYELVQTPAGRKRLADHHKTFIKEADFKWLANNKIEIIRLPVGHWIFDDSAPYLGALDRLDWAFDMAEKYNLKVFLDLHGAPGAQNAEAHSGSGGPGRSRWLDNPQHQELTINVLQKLARRYHDHAALWGIEIINEPTTDKIGLKLIRFYRRAYRQITKELRPGTHVVFSDGFKPLFLTGALRSKRRFPVVMDCHFYQCFGAYNYKLSPAAHLRRTIYRRWLIRFLSLFQPVLVGEWSGVLPRSLAKDLSLDERRQLAARYIAAQEVAHQGTVAHFYWNYKFHEPGGWDYRSLVEQGIMVE